MGTIWHDLLYQPTFNLLIWVYNNWTDLNLGWAIVYVTLLLRFALLPFTLITERNKVRNQELAEDIIRLEKEYQSDPVVKKEEIRKVMKKRKVQPWAKIVVLGIQALFLVLLYQVFLRGVTGEKVLKILYPSIQFPGAINTNFYGFELGATHDVVWSGVVALLLLVGIYSELRKRKGSLSKNDLFYFIFFPAAVFLFLWVLPMAKSLFFLTSMVFTIFVSFISSAVFRTPKKS